MAKKEEKKKNVMDTCRRSSSSDRSMSLLSTALGWFGRSVGWVR